MTELAIIPSAEIVKTGVIDSGSEHHRPLATDDAKEREMDAHIVGLWVENHRSVNTQRAYRQDLAQFFAFSRRPLCRTRLEDLLAYSRELDRRKLAAATRRRMLGAVKSLFKFAAGDGIRRLQMNPAAALCLPRARDRRAERILTEQQVAALLAAAANDRDRFLITLGYRTAVRVEELVNLRWRDAQPMGDGGVLTIFGKGEKTRHVHLEPAEWQMLQQQRHPTDTEDDAIVKGRGGKPLSKAQAWRVVHNTAKRAGLKAGVSPHWLRHAHATHAIDRGADIRTVQATLGHSSVSTTESYIHCRPKKSSSAFLPPLVAKRD